MSMRKCSATCTFHVETISIKVWAEDSLLRYLEPLGFGLMELQSQSLRPEDIDFATLFLNGDGFGADVVRPHQFLPIIWSSMVPHPNIAIVPY